MLLLLMVLLLAPPVLLLLLLLLSTIPASISLPIISLSHVDRPTRQVDVYPSLIGLGMVLQPQLPTNLLDPGLDLLNMPWAVIPLPDNHMQMVLPRLLRVPDPLLEDILRLLDELPVQVDRVGGDAPRGVVLPEDVLGGLFVVLGHRRAVLLAFFREGVGRGPVARGVGLLRAGEARAAFAGFLASEGAEAVVFRFGAGGGAVVEGVGADMLHGAHFVGHVEWWVGWGCEVLNGKGGGRRLEEGVQVPIRHEVGR